MDYKIKSNNYDREITRAGKVAVIRPIDQSEATGFWETNLICGMFFR